MSTTQRHKLGASEGNGMKNGCRPASIYDNCTENSNHLPSDSFIKETRFDGSPSQAYCLTTTVPQNIAAASVSSKHTPNRNSLRHSRMLAMNKDGRVPRKYLPPIIRYHKLSKALLGLILLLGLAICFLSLWLLLWAPNIRHRENPHWSGIPVLLSGIVGLTLLCCFRKEHPGTKKNYFVYAFKVLSVSLSFLAAVASLTAASFAIIHLVALYSMSCAPPAPLDKTCFCAVPSADNSTVAVQSYHYTDLSCVEVDNILTILIMFSVATNLIAGILEVWYVYLHWASRYKYTYSKVKTDENKRTVITNFS